MGFRIDQVPVRSEAGDEDVVTIRVQEISTQARGQQFKTTVDGLKETIDCQSGRRVVGVSAKHGEMTFDIAGVRYKQTTFTNPEPDRYTHFASSLIPLDVTHSSTLD